LIAKLAAIRDLRRGLDVVFGSSVEDVAFAVGELDSVLLLALLDGAFVKTFDGPVAAGFTSEGSGVTSFLASIIFSSNSSEGNENSFSANNSMILPFLTRFTGTSDSSDILLFDRLYLVIGGLGASNSANSSLLFKPSRSKYTPNRCHKSSDDIFVGLYLLKYR